ncbi:hypothetical protein RHMOL_Rhmol09G0017200 [Rhododendron molle]|uniref:Uncharacterized protein n=1 Tax=Rhododendron molle TaxID=49168 RepID=A0ACC0M8S8_RHOML|nr:hypothetical protein RHMOL_Rhmol09G0017200 [Rhododendron molle]
MSEFKSLPMETVADILIRLPVESLRHCMCVCKSWRSLIADLFFINNQLVINRQRFSTAIDNRCFLLRSRKVFGDNVFYSLRYGNTFTEQKQLKLPNVIKGWPYTIIASCNGLLRLFMGYSRVLLSLYGVFSCPSLMESFNQEIQGPPEASLTISFRLRTNSWVRVRPRANDYKVVRLIHNSVEGSTKVEIYSEHKFLENVDRQKNLLILSTGIIDGGPSWDLWVLEDYGGAEFWTKLHTIRLHTTESYLYHLQSLKNGGILFGGLNRKELYLFDMERQEIKQIEVDGVPFEVINYTESLVLLNEGIHDSSDAMSDLEKAMEEEVKEKLGILLKAKWILKYAMDLFKCKGIDVRV